MTLIADVFAVIDISEIWRRKPSLNPLITVKEFGLKKVYLRDMKNLRTVC